MKTFGFVEAKTQFASLLERVERGEEITVTKHGRPVARLAPVVRAASSTTREIIERSKTARKGRSLGKLS